MPKHCDCEEDVETIVERVMDSIRRVLADAGDRRIKIVVNVNVAYGGGATINVKGK